MGWFKERKLRSALREQSLELEQRRLGIEARLLETASVTTNFVDPLDALRDPTTGEIWDQLGLQGTDRFKVGPSTEAELAEVRQQCRYLARSNGWAINGHENRISYIVGTGHVYTVSAKPGVELADEKIDEVQAVIDEFCEDNKWQHRQQEIVLRKDRDGECFLRFFEPEPGKISIRFVEPEDVTAPAQETRAYASFGIVTDPDDVEAVKEYLITGENPVPADQIQHRKANVDCNVKRGLPLFYSVRQPLQKAERMLLNIAIVSEIQTSIAMIRRHQRGTKTGLQSLSQDDPDVTVNNTVTGKTHYYNRYQPGTILDVSQNTEYDFPASGIDVTRYALGVQAVLRLVASRVVMPEFMLTSDASNANYSSTMVAEGPAVKMFQRLQWDMIEDDLEVMGRVLDAAVQAGLLDPKLRESIEITAEPPRVETRNRKEEVEADMSLVTNKVMSKHTAMLRQDLDPEAEEEHLDEEREKADPFQGMGFGVPGAGVPGKPPGNQKAEDKPPDEDDEQ